MSPRRLPFARPLPPTDRTPDLAAVMARLDRADEHVRAVDAAVAAYAATPAFFHQRIVADDLSTITERVNMVLPPPAIIALTVSDAVHQMRAALDNLVSVLRPGGATDGSGFPIHRDATAWEVMADRQLAGVPGWARDEIRRLQPFTDDPWRWVGDHLVGLHDLARRDRHRAPVIHAGVVRPDYAEGEIIAFRGDRAGTWAETEYATTNLVRAHFKVEVTIDEPDIPEVDGWEAGSLLSGIARDVRYIVVDRLTRLRAA